jgi:hypothetical protein
MTDTYNPILSSGDDDTSRAYLFTASGQPAVHAVTRDPGGANLPAPASGSDWMLDREFALGVREVIPLNVAPEPILRGLAIDGYFVWRDGSNPVGTSQ